MKPYGRPAVIVTDRLRSYQAAMTVIGNAATQDYGQWLNNRAVNSHLPFRRREGAMPTYRDVRTPLKFGAVHASIHNYPVTTVGSIAAKFPNATARSAVLAERRQLAA